MQLGVIDLGPVGGPIVRRLVQGGHQCVVFDACPRLVAEIAAEGAYGVSSLACLARELDAPRTILVASPSDSVDRVIAGLLPSLVRDDVVVDCSESFYIDALRHAAALAAAGVHYVDVGLSGGTPMHQGYCLTIGGDGSVVARLQPLFRSLARDAAGFASIDQAAPRTSEESYLHCGPAGAGHFVNMVHNGIQRSLMEAYAEAFSVLRAAKDPAIRCTPAAGRSMLAPDRVKYELNLTEIAEVWRHGSLVESPVLDLTMRALEDDAAAGVPTAADGSFPSRLLAAMRWHSPATAGLWSHDRPRHVGCRNCLAEAARHDHVR